MLRVGDRVAGGRVLETDHCHDVARVRRVLVLPVVRVHLEDAADPFLPVLGRVEDVRARLEHPGVDAQVREPSDVRIGHDLEGERGEGLVIVRSPGDLVPLQGGRDERGHVEGRREVPDDRVQQRLYTLVLEGGTTEHGDTLVRERRTTDRPPELVDRRLFLMDELLHEGLVVVGQTLEQVVTSGSGRGRVLLGDVLVPPLLPHLAFPDVGLHLHEVDHALEVGLGPPRELQDERERLEAVDHHVDGPREVGAGAVHLVDEADARDVVAIGLAPDGLGLRLDTGHRVEHRDGAIEDPKRALDLDGEVDVTGRVDDVDPVALPRARGGGGRDGDAALALLDHPVHLRGALVDLADLVGLAGVVEDALGRGGLARVDVGHDPDVPGQGERVLTDLQDLGGLALDVLFGLGHVRLLRHLLRGARHLDDPPLMGNRPLEAGSTFLVDHHR